MVLFELGSSLVTPPWLPLALVVVIGGVIVLLYRSMRRHLDRIDVPYRSELDAGSAVGPGSPGSPSA